jgi:hypothetical protein
MNAMKITFQDGPEAREWLRHSNHESALAHNRFDSTASALAFVEQLYAAGARRVFVPGDSIVADEEELAMGGPYSDHLVIELYTPDVPPVLAALYRAEATLDGWTRSDDWLPVIRDQFLLLWWS